MRCVVLGVKSSLKGLVSAEGSADIFVDLNRDLHVNGRLDMFLKSLKTEIP